MLCADEGYTGNPAETARACGVDTKEGLKRVNIANENYLNINLTISAHFGGTGGLMIDNKGHFHPYIGYGIANWGVGLTVTGGAGPVNRGWNRATQVAVFVAASNGEGIERGKLTSRAIPNTESAELGGGLAIGAGQIVYYVW